MLERLSQTLRQSAKGWLMLVSAWGCGGDGESRAAELLIQAALCPANFSAP